MSRLRICSIGFSNTNAIYNLGTVHLREHENVELDDNKKEIDAKYCKATISHINKYICAYQITVEWADQTKDFDFCFEKLGCDFNNQSLNS